MYYSNSYRYDDILLGLLYARASTSEHLTLQDTKIGRFSTALENTSEVQKVISSSNDSNLP